MQKTIFNSIGLLFLFIVLGFKPHFPDSDSEITLINFNQASVQQAVAGACGEAFSIASLDMTIEGLQGESGCYFELNAASGGLLLAPSRLLIDFEVAHGYTLGVVQLSTSCPSGCSTIICYDAQGRTIDTKTNRETSNLETIALDLDDQVRRIAIQSWEGTLVSLRFE